MPIPTGTTQLELWFEGRGPAGTTGWDSRYGQNYTLLVAADGPAIPDRPVLPRPEATIDPNHIAWWRTLPPKNRPPFGKTGRRLTEQAVHARIGERSGSTVAWADVHVFNAPSDLIQSGTVKLQQPEPSGADGAFRLHDDIYQGSGGSEVGVWSRPDAHTVQYRLYCFPREWRLRVLPTEREMERGPATAPVGTRRE